MKRRLFLQSSVAAAVAAALPLRAALAAAAEITGNVNAVTGAGAEVTLEKAAVQELADSLLGQLLLPGQEGYDVSRHVLNPVIDKYPALVVRPSGAADIMNGLRSIASAQPKRVRGNSRSRKRRSRRQMPTRLPYS